MKNPTVSTWMRGRAMAAVACAALALPLIGCGSGGGANTGTASGANLPPVDDTRGGTTAPAMRPTMAAQPQHQGMSTKKKVVLLVGAAALYYLWRKHQANAQNASAGATQGQPVYYLSKNGRVYYRDANAQAHWVTPPAGGIQASQDEIQQYQGIEGLQGYDNQTTGDTDLTRFATQGNNPGGM